MNPRSAPHHIGDLAYVSATAAVAAWAHARLVDVQRREFDNSLITVGPDKPLGSLGIRSGLDSARIFAKLLLRNPMMLVQPAAVAKAPDLSGHVWVYMWHRRALPALLDRHQQVLRSAGWPTEATAFVERCRAEMVPHRTDLYEVIADAYGDHWNPGRRDIIHPAVDPHVLLDAFYELAGFPDPAAIFIVGAP